MVSPAPSDMIDADDVDEAAEGETRDHEDDFADEKPKEEHREIAARS